MSEYIVSANRTLQVLKSFGAPFFRGALFTANRTLQVLKYFSKAKGGLSRDAANRTLQVLKSYSSSLGTTQINLLIVPYRY